MFFSHKQIRELNGKAASIRSRYEKIALDLFVLKLRNPDSYEYLTQGVVRRIDTLRRCIENIYKIHPPGRKRKPTKNELKDLAIQLHSFVANVYGCIDNLAWIWVKETNYEFRQKTEISFSNRKIRKNLSVDFQNYLDSDRNKIWFKELEDFRHALAHRIPLYVPPYALTPDDQKKYNDLEREITLAYRTSNFDGYNQLLDKQEELGVFVPCMAHSYSEREKPPIIFHAQVLADWSTVEKYIEMFLKELSSIYTPKA